MSYQQRERPYPAVADFTLTVRELPPLEVVEARSQQMLASVLW